MNYYKLTIAYDGTDYAGWNVQPGKKTIFQTLHSTFARTFSHDFHLIGASRTDAGVHAEGQVARLSTEMSIASEQLLFAWNNALPLDIQIKKIERVSKNFHPWYNVECKTYDYYVFTQRPTPFVARYGWKYPYPFDAQLLRQALDCFVGTHDFASFTKAQDDREDTFRTIMSIDCQWVPEMCAYKIRIIGNKFMWNMIRRMVGAALTVATKNEYTIETIITLLAKSNSNHPLRNAPACGLVLKEIKYIQE